MSASTDLTKGKILPQLIKYAIPLIVSGVLQAMYGIADMAVAGHFIGPGGISGISNSNTVLMMLTQIVIGLTMGGNILIGQYFGAGDKEGCRRSAGTLLSMSVLIGVALAGIFYSLSLPILSALGAPAMDDSLPYMKICSLGFIAICGYNGAAAALRAVGNSRATLICVAISSILNIALDIIFVGGLSMGTSGAALATIISQYLSFTIALVIVFRDRETFCLTLKTLRVHIKTMKRILKLGIPCAVQLSVAGMSWIVVTFLINSHGVNVSAGFGVSNRIKDFTMLFIATMSTAATGMIAQNIGAKEYERAKKVMYTAMKVTISTSAVIICLVQVFAPVLVRLFTDDPATAAAAEKNLRIEIFGQLFFASFLVYHSLALGSGNTWYVFFSSFVNCILVRLILASILNRYFGATGIYVACMIAPSASVPIGIWYERSNRWRRSLADGQK